MSHQTKTNLLHSDKELVEDQSAPPMPQEGWVPVAGYEGFYEIHPSGLVRSVPRTLKAGRGVRIYEGRLVSYERAEGRDEYVNLYRNAIRRRISLKKLLRETFDPSFAGEPTLTKPCTKREHTPTEIKKVFLEYYKAPKGKKKHRLAELCVEFQFSDTTFWDWRKRYPEWWNAVGKDADEEHNAELRARAQALVQRRQAQLQKNVLHMKAVRH